MWQEFNKTLDIFTVEKRDDPVMNDLIAGIDQEMVFLNESFHVLTQCLIEECPEAEQEEFLSDVLGSLDEVYDLVIAMTVEINREKGKPLYQGGDTGHRGQTIFLRPA